MNFCRSCKGEHAVAEGSDMPSTSASIAFHPQTTETTETTQTVNRIILRRASGSWAVNGTGATGPRKSTRRKAPKRTYDESHIFARSLPLPKKGKRGVLIFPDDSSTDDAISNDEIDEHLGFSYHDTIEELNQPVTKKAKISRGGKSRTIGSLFSVDQNRAKFNEASPVLKVSS